MNSNTATKAEQLIAHTDPQTGRILRDLLSELACQRSALTEVLDRYDVPAGENQLARVEALAMGLARCLDEVAELKREAKLSTITRASVLAALAEAKELGADAFCVKYGYRRGRYTVEGIPSKAVVGVAYGITHQTSPLSSRDFSGGAATCQTVLERLGFDVQVRS